MLICFQDFAFFYLGLNVWCGVWEILNIMQINVNSDKLQLNNKDHVHLYLSGILVSISEWFKKPRENTFLHFGERVNEQQLEDMSIFWRK